MGLVPILTNGATRWRLLRRLRGVFVCLPGAYAARLTTFRHCVTEESLLNESAWARPTLQKQYGLARTMYAALTGRRVVWGLGTQPVRMG